MAADPDLPRYAFDFLDADDRGQLFVPPVEGVVIARRRHNRRRDGWTQLLRITLKRADRSSSVVVMAFVEELGTRKKPPPATSPGQHATSQGCSRTSPMSYCSATRKDS